PNEQTPAVGLLGHSGLHRYWRLTGLFIADAGVRICPFLTEALRPQSLSDVAGVLLPLLLFCFCFFVFFLFFFELGFQAFPVPLRTLRLCEKRT
ncbi:MAG TPA: hypothetical protein VK864_02930, partial [Longimicrobiales bacterium]|nr:hypothetical protein [Longimicrobiales bacterium]